MSHPSIEATAASETIGVAWKPASSSPATNGAIAKIIHGGPSFPGVISVLGVGTALGALTLAELARMIGRDRRAATGQRAGAR